MPARLLHARLLHTSLPAHLPAHLLSLLLALLALLAAAPALAQAPSLDQARQQLERIDARLAGLPGLFLNSNAYRGIALNDCVRESRLAAERIAQAV